MAKVLREGVKGSRDHRPIVCGSCKAGGATSACTNPLCSRGHGAANPRPGNLDGIERGTPVQVDGVTGFYTFMSGPYADGSVIVYGGGRPRPDNECYRQSLFVKADRVHVDRRSYAPHREAERAQAHRDAKRAEAAAAKAAPDEAALKAKRSEAARKAVATRRARQAAAAAAVAS